MVAAAFAERGPRPRRGVEHDIVLGELTSVERELAVQRIASQAAQRAHRAALQSMRDEIAAGNNLPAGALEEERAEHAAEMSRMRTELARLQGELEHARSLLDAERASARKALEAEREASESGGAVWRAKLEALEREHQRKLRRAIEEHGARAAEEVSERATAAAAEISATATAAAQSSLQEAIATRDAEIESLRAELAREQQQWRKEVVHSLKTQRQQWLLQAASERQDFADEMRELLLNSVDGDAEVQQREDEQAQWNARAVAQLRQLHASAAAWREELRGECAARVDAAITGLQASAIDAVRTLAASRDESAVELQRLRAQMGGVAHAVRAQMGEHVQAEAARAEALGAELAERGAELDALRDAATDALGARAALVDALQQLEQLWTAVEATAGERARLSLPLAAAVFEADAAEEAAGEHGGAVEQARARGGGRDAPLASFHPELRSVCARLRCAGAQQRRALALCRHEARRLSDQLPVVERMAQREHLKQRIALFAKGSTDPVRLFATGRRGAEQQRGGRGAHAQSARLLAEERTRSELYAQLKALNEALATMIPAHEQRWGRWARAEAYLDAIHARDVQQVERQAELGNLQRTAAEARSPRRAAPVPFR